MKNIKQTIIGVFAIIGVLAILTGSTNTTPQPTYATPESHVWDLKCSIPPNVGSGKNEFSKGIQSKEADCYFFNKVTGEVRFLAQEGIDKEVYDQVRGQIRAGYVVMTDFN